MCHPARQINDMYYWMVEPHTSVIPCIFRHISKTELWFDIKTTTTTTKT